MTSFPTSPGPTSTQSRPALYILWSSIAAVLGFWAMGIYALSVGHPNEDAYILLIYAENLAAGEGISFFQGSGPLEGATDFLWMVSIAILRYLGINAAVACVLLNGLGAGVIAGCASWGITRSAVRGLPLVCTFFVLAILCSGATLAAYLCFGTAFYCAPIAVATVLLHGNRRARNLIPYFGLVMALIRPDGVIVGGGFCLATLILSQDAKERVSIFRTIGICGIVGSLYFLFRFQYFGQLLPLPLYVKSNGDGGLSGLAPTLRWGLRILPLVAVAGLCTLKQSSEERKKLLAACIPPGLLLTSLLFAHQSQNQGFRFQAPADTVLLILVAIHGKCLIRRSNRVFEGIVLLLLAAQLGNGVRRLLILGAALSNHTYMDQFPFLTRNLFPEDTVSVITEAGRYAYWNRGDKYDLVGLNTVESAIDGPSVEFIESKSPDIFFVNTSRLLDAHFCGTQSVCRIDAPTFLREWQESKAKLSPGERTSRINSTVASIEGLDYILKHRDELEIFLVDLAGYYDHLYAVRKDGKVDPEHFAQKLDESFERTPRSYLGLIQELKTNHEKGAKQPTEPAHRSLVR